MRVVIDTNVWVSALMSARALAPRSVPARVVDLAAQRDRIIMTDATLQELDTVLGYPRLRQYLDAEKCLSVLDHLAVEAQIAEPAQAIRQCRDPKDDKFLEAAVWGNADCIVTGDADLLVLHPFRGIRICRPADFLLDA